MDETWTKHGRSMDKRLYYRLCVSRRIDTWQIVYLLYEDACPIISIAVICVTKSRTGDYDFRACARARARGFRGSTFSVGRIRFAVCAERSHDKTCVF